MPAEQLAGDRQRSVGAHGDWASRAVFHTSVGAERIWPVLSDPATWPAWWHEVECVRLGDHLEEERRGHMRLRGLPPLPVRVRSVAPCSRLALQSSVGPLLMEIEFALRPQERGGTEIAELVTIVGPCARLAGRLFDDRRGEHFTLSMTRLVSLAVVAAHGDVVLRAA